MAEDNEFIDKLNIDDNLDNLDGLNVVFVGNVDNGKSTTCGHILVNLGYIDGRRFAAITTEAITLKKEKSKYAHVLDTTDIEQQTGKTMDFIVVPFTVSNEHFEKTKTQQPEWLKNEKYQNKTINFIDTPGHNQLIRAMIEGAHIADVAVLMCSVKKGEFESGMCGQTKEHLYILKGLGVKQLVVVYNKMDIIDWNVELLQHYQQQMNTFLKRVKFDVVKSCAVSGWDGLNITDNYDHKSESNVYGNNLLQTILDSEKRNAEKVMIDPVTLKQTVIKSKSMEKVTIDPKSFIVDLLFLEDYTDIAEKSPGDKSMKKFNLATVGFQAVLHNLDKHYTFEITELMYTFVKVGKEIKKKKPKIGEPQIIRPKDQVGVRLSIPNWPDKELVLTRNVIVRYEDLTIAIGVIVPSQRNVQK